MCKYKGKWKNIKSWFNSIDKKNFLYIIPVVILILVISFQVSYFCFETSITNKIIDTMNNDKGITNDTIILINKFIDTYNNQFLSLGLEIIGVAISVWIGLNIYNIIKRDSIRELEEQANKTQTDLNEFSDNYTQFNIIAIENAHIQEDRINTYFINEFTQKHSNVLNYKLTKYIVFFEKSFESIIESYGNNNSTLMESHLNKLKNEIDMFKKEIDLKSNSLNDEERRFIRSYITCRLADYNYYYGLYHKSIDEYASARKFLLEAENNYLQIITKYKINDKTVNIYINNVLGYIYQLFHNMCNNRNIDEKKEFAKKAYDYSKNACLDKDGNNLNTGYVRDYRNYGVNIENYIKYYIKGHTSDYIMKLFEAYNQYLMAYKLDSKDIKTLTCLSSCILKIFDRIIKIHSDNNGRYKDLSTIDISEVDKKLKALKINYTSTQLIESAYRYLSSVFLIDNTSVEAHYHMIHVHMYQYLISGKEKTFKERGLKEIENVITLSFGKDTPKSFKFKARNFYYAIGDNKNGNLYQKKIESYSLS